MVFLSRRTNYVTYRSTEVQEPADEKYVWSDYPVGKVFFAFGTLCCQVPMPTDGILDRELVTTSAGSWD